MKILFSSVSFHPVVGGIETVSDILAERFHALGHEVVLLTQTPWTGTDHRPYKIVRTPGSGALRHWVRWSDLVFQNNISVRLAWPLLFIRRPFVIAHHTWIEHTGSRLTARIKRLALRFASNIAVSEAVAQAIERPCTIIPNPYADDVFSLDEAIPRDQDLIFVGRLVSDKGVAVLLDALAKLKEGGVNLRLTIVGLGPEEEPLRNQLARHGLADAITFAGRKTGTELVALLNAHRIIVVPSVWEEPFGLVALEGMACGCVPVVSDCGGLRDAVGACGVLFRKGDSAALADALDRIIRDDEALALLRSRFPAHLQEHARDRIAQRYMKVVEDAFRTHL